MIDVESFVEQFTDCYQHLWLIAASVTGDRVEAEDIVQEASLIGLEKRPNFDAGTNFVGWMSQIVRLTALNYRNKSDRRSLRVADPVKIDQSNSIGADDTGSAYLPLMAEGRLTEDQTAFDDEVMSALLEVSEIARTCLLLRVVSQLSYDDIAQTLQIPTGTAMSYVHRAKRSIRERLISRDRQSSISR